MELEEAGRQLAALRTQFLTERTAEALRGELAAAPSEARDPAVAHAEARARLEAQATALTDRLAAAEQALGRQALELERVSVHLRATCLRPGSAATDFRRQPGRAVAVRLTDATMNTATTSVRATELQ
ncbi:hypothetical protein [Cupriavidus pinatubonensis]|uniref:hypothetical protein n=1 Tax=Cupriavidus pinatubonensis TaxID=248026 RepID=UPI0037C171F1